MADRYRNWLRTLGAPEDPVATDTSSDWSAMSLLKAVYGQLLTGVPVTSGGTGTVIAFTAGSIVFAGAAGVYTQDNANLFWDNSNNRLGIGTASPLAGLDARKTVNVLASPTLAANDLAGNTGEDALGLLVVRSTTVETSLKEFMGVFDLVAATGAGAGNAGNKVSLYAGVSSTTNAGNTWAGNLVNNILSGSNPEYAHILELDISNLTGSHRGDADGLTGLAATPASFGLNISGGGASRNTAGILVSGPGSNTVWNRGIVFANASIRSSTFQDLTDSVTSVDIRGTHTYCIDMVGSPTSAQIRLRNNCSIVWRNAAGNADLSALAGDSSDKLNVGSSFSTVFTNASLGVGTSTPATTLDVNGTATALAYSITAPSGALSILPVGNALTTKSSISVQGSRQSSTVREFMASFGMTSTVGFSASSYNVDGVTLYAGVDGQTGSGDIWALNTVTNMAANLSNDINAHGYELDFNNVYKAYTTLSPLACGMSISGAGTFLSSAALLITGTISSLGVNPIWTMGLVLAGPSVRDYSIYDATSSVTAHLVQGAHTHGVEMSGATFSGNAFASPSFSVSGAGVATAAFVVTPIVVGGAGATSTLSLRPTTGAGTTGADIILQTGNNGASERMRILSSGLIGIGTASPGVALDVSADQADTTIRVTGAGTVTPFLTARRAMGSIASPTTIDATSRGLLTLDAHGYDGAAYAAGASINFQSNGAWTGSSHAGRMLFQTVSASSTTLTERMRIADALITYNNSTQHLYPEVGGLGGSVPSGTVAYFDMTALANNVKRAINIDVRTSSTSGTINAGGIAINIFTPPDNGGDVSGIYVAQTGGGNAGSFFNLSAERPGGYTQYASQGFAIEAQVDGTKTSIFSSSENGAVFLGNIRGSTGKGVTVAPFSTDTDLTRRAYQITNAAGSTELAYITLAGVGYFASDVGVGISPTFRLHVAGASTAGPVTALAIGNPSSDSGTSEIRQEFHVGGSMWGALAVKYNNNAPYMGFGVSSAGGTYAERARLTSAGNIKMGGSALRGTTEGTNHLDIFDGTAPVGTLANGCSIYSTSGELRVMDAAGNATLISPHDSRTNEWIYHSVDTRTGRGLRIDMERMMRAVNERFGWDFVHEFTEAA